MLPNVLRTDAADHVPVLAEEVASSSRPAGGDLVDATFGAGGHSRMLAADLQGRGKLIAIDRDPTVRPYFDRLKASVRGVQTRFLRGDYAVVLSQLAATASGRTPCCSTSVSPPCRSTGPSAASRTPPTRRSTCGWTLPTSRRGRDRQHLGRARARDHLPPLRRGALRAPDRTRHRPTPRGGADRAHRAPRRRRARLDPGARALRRGTPGEAGVPGAPDRGQPRARIARGRPAGVVRDAPPRRASRGDQFPLARGSDREALPARSRPRVHVSARAACLRVRARAGAPHPHAEAGPPLRERDRVEPASRVRAPAGGSEGLGRCRPWHRAARAARARTRSRGETPPLAGGVIWIVLFAVLLAGVVAVNVACCA